MQINIRYTVKEYLIVSENAQALGISITDYIRRKSTGRAVPRRKVSADDRKLFVELGRIGNNINQLTKKMHTGNHYPKQLRNEVELVKSVLESLTQKLVQDDS